MRADLLRLALLSVLALLLTSCGPENGREEPPSMQDRMGPAMMESMMGMMEGMPEGIPASELPEPDSRGARLVARYCGQCHAISSPGRLSAAEWPATLERMVVRMEQMEEMGGMMGRMMEDRMGPIEAPSPEEQQVILDYLQTHSLRAASEEDLPEGGPGRTLFTRTCAQCHALPDPGQNPAEAWPAVVERMREHMRDMDVEEITDEDAEAITRYLQGVAEASGRGR